MNPILVTGATGAIGSHVVRELRERGAAVRAFVRDPKRAACVLGAGVELAVGNFGEPASIRAALHGVERVLLCCGNHPGQVADEANVIDAAAAAGVRRLVKIGVIWAEIGSPQAFWDAHGRIEEHLRASGLPAVVLHPGFSMANLLAAAEPIRHGGPLVAPAGEAKLAMVDPRDVAAVAAVVLTDGDAAGHVGRTYPLTGPVATTYAEVAAELTAVLGRAVPYVDVPDAAAREAMVGAGVPEWLADQLVILWGLLRQGVAEPTTDVVRVLTGREPRSVAEFVRDHAGAFRP